MSPAGVIVVLALAAVATTGGWLLYQLLDRRDHRRFVTGLSVLGGSDVVRAGGQAFRSVGDPPTLDVSAPGTRLALGSTDEAAPPDGAAVPRRPERRARHRRR